MSFKEFFYFNKSDRKALLFLLIVGVGATLLFYIFSDQEKLSSDIPPYDTIFVHQRMYRYDNSKNSTKYYQVKNKTIELFPFDPNTADSSALLRLGLQSWQVRNIYKYRAAGGIYRNPTDFARLYGLTLKQYRMLEPYIRISSDYRPASEFIKSTAQSSAPMRDTVHFPNKLKPTEHIAINTADTTMLKKVPGIGSYFARQIVNYRRKLGGFYSTKQLLEIDNFPEEALTYFSLSPSEVSKIHRLAINKLTLKQLRRHPYIGYYRARAITDYRRLKGPIHSLDDLSMLHDFSPTAIEQLKPYISYEE